MSVYVSIMAIWSRRVDNGVDAVATAFLRLNAQSSNLYWADRGKLNHLLVHMISSDIHCVFSTSKLATKGRQRSVLSDNEANRTNTNIKQTTNSRMFRSGWFALYNCLVKRTGDVCKPNRVVRFTLHDNTQSDGSV